MTITLYDIPSNRPNIAWSVNTWKVRYALNYKGIPYTTEWVEYPDIEKRSKELNIKPSSKKPDGSNHYTLPAIHDPSTGVLLADSVRIAQYLDITYPDTPPVFPHGTIGLQIAFHDAFWDLFLPIVGFVLPAIGNILNPVSKEFFLTTRAADFGRPLDEIEPQGPDAFDKWAKLQENFDKIDEWYAKTDDRGPFLLGSELSWCDILVASHLMSMREVWGQDSDKHRRYWKVFKGWNEGRWEGLLNHMEKYAKVH